MTFKAGLRWHTALGLILLALTGPAVAQTNGLVDISVVNRNTGETLRTWYHHGRLYVAGDPGARYGLRFTNHTGQRVLAVVSVDGVNIITGETANHNERGYVLSPWETIDVNGWRKSETTIADFQFASLSNSYAARTGRPGDVGVIGMAVFEERKPLPPRPLDSGMVGPMPDISREAPMKIPAPRAAAPAAPPPPPAAMLSPAPAPRIASEATARASTARADEKLGTGHGASEWSVITLVDFVRATSAPQAITSIEYDTWDHLVANGAFLLTPVIIPMHFRENRASATFPIRLLTLGNSIPGRSGLDLMVMAQAPAVDEDSELLRAYAGGDREAFARLYDRHDQACFKFIRRLLGSTGADAEDLHQETWLAVSRHAASFDPRKASFAAWLYTIARRKVWDHFRKQKITHLVSGQEELMAEVPDAGPTPLQQAESRETALAIVKAVEALPLVQRETFLLFVECGLSLEKIAEITEVSAETSKSRLRYARTSLRRHLSEREAIDG